MGGGGGGGGAAGERETWHRAHLSKLRYLSVNLCCG